MTGRARVIDGDTLEVAGERIRLYGIDAPELSQVCTRGGGDWACGDWAKAELAGLIGAGALVCEGRERDRYGRLVATCRAQGRDVAEAMVLAGAAFAYRRYALDYVDAEKEALFASRGMWAGEAEAPAAVRAATRAAPDPAAAAGCSIKGNISGSGQIFHVPGQEHYAETRISPSRGERWFCSEAEAVAAGWRKARR